MNVDITTKTCPIAIQSVAQLSGHEGDCSAVALPGFDYRVTDSKSLNAKIDRRDPQRGRVPVRRTSPSGAGRSHLP